MFYWTPYTFVRIVFFFIAGIVLGIYQPDLIPDKVAWFLFIGCVTGFLILSRFKYKINPGVLGLMAVLFAGYSNTLLHTESRRADHFLHEKVIKQYIAVVAGFEEEKTKSWKVEAHVQYIFDSANWKPVSGKMLWYFSKEDFPTPFSYGDRLLIQGSPNELKGPANPGEFDYKRFLTFKKIYHQQFLRKESVHWIENDPPHAIMAYALTARRWAESVLEKHIHGNQERAVASALILGVKDGLDNELVQAYASSGAMHVLAVSGLHVGIIYFILMLFLKPLKQWRYGKWMLAVISILALWAYAFVTGLSPSVLRAVTMFTVIALSRPLNYSTNIYNTLAVAAFALLVYEPYLIMSVGFQLSFLAVIGIVYVQPKLAQLWEPNNGLLDKVWQVTCVSFAAQLATFSLGLLYFHQFPVYFLVSNLFVIPGAFISLLMGVVLLMVSPLDVVASWIGQLLEGILGLLNYLVFAVERWPYSLINNIYITTAQSWLIVGIVLFALLLFQYRKYIYLMGVSACALLFGLTQWVHYQQEINQEKFVVYSVAGHHAMEWMDRGKSFLFADSLLVTNADRMRFHIRPNRLISGIERIHYNESAFVQDIPGGRLYSWKGKTFLQLTSPDFSLPDNLKIDYVIISYNSVRSLTQLNTINYKQIIIDSSNVYYNVNRLMKEAMQLQLPVHSVLQHGAFSIKL
ncbi:MAG: ComEC/Rec2 family competence protein [Cyclobacteriaceae bacterium]|nr:MAG: ComEC/Rec2 family competence protein [Cyclobacteriaceae bacterium]